MKNKFLKLALYCQRFGFVHGIKLLSKIYFAKKNEIVTIQIPDYHHPVFLRAKSSDEYIFQQIFINQEYEFTIHKTPDTIIDAGANIGFAAVYFAHKYPNAKIICLEPEPSNFILLRKNISNYPNIIPIQKGLWDKSTHLQIIDNGLDIWGFTVQECTSDVTGAIEATSLPDIMKQFSIYQLSIVKMDIEGSEKEVLMAPDVHDWLAKCDTLVIELHDRMKEGTSKTLFETLSPYKISMDLKGENLIFRLPRS